MTLRVRLTLAFALVVTVPLVIGALLVARGVPGALDDATRNRLVTGRAGVTALLQQTCVTARLAAEVLGRDASTAGAKTAVRALLERGLVGYAVVTDPEGRVLASAGSVPGAEQPRPEQLGSCSRDTPQAPGIRAVADTVELDAPNGKPIDLAAAAIPFDAAMQRRLAAAAGAEVTLVADGKVVGSTLGVRTAAHLTSHAEQAVHAPRPIAVNGRLVTAVSARGDTLVVVSLERQSVAPLMSLMGIVVLGSLLLAVVMGWQLARVTTRPVVELADAAARVAGGDLDTQIAVRSRDEVGRLAVAFNEMTDELRSYIRELESSRDELRRNIGRLGDTLSSTHDLGRILAVILETAMASSQAQSGAIFLTAVGGDEIYVKVSRGLNEAQLAPGTRIRLGEGVTGQVALTGQAVHGRVGEGLTLSPHEPAARCLIVEPLRSSGELLGVLGLFDRADADDFDAGDLESIRSFASQASVAIDNVLLHQEAQRLSITDGLTGLWNYRYFQMTLGKEVERAVRFDRPLALLMLDLDHFKQVNDEFGHQRGDAVLIEFARRVKSQVREVDVLARYGGEELVCVLPETDRAGAEHTAGRICEAVRTEPYGGERDVPLRVTVSVGVAVFPEHGRNGNDLIRAADEALYVAKHDGRDRWRTAPVHETVTPPPTRPAPPVT